MESTVRAGRPIGVLIILQMVCSPIVNFGLEAPLFGTPGFLLAAANHSRDLGLAVVLGLMTEASWVGIAITVFPVCKQRSPATALWLIVLAGVVLAMAVVESAAVMSMLSLSEAYAKASATERAQLETLRVVVASARNWPHFLARIFDGLTALVFYGVLYRCALVPRVLAGFGLITALLMVAGLGVTLFGHEVIFPMLAPLGLSQLMLALWLLVKGFRGQPGDEIRLSA